MKSLFKNFTFLFSIIASVTFVGCDTDPDKDIDGNTDGKAILS